MSSGEILKSKNETHLGGQKNTWEEPKITWEGEKSPGKFAGKSQEIGCLNLANSTLNPESLVADMDWSDEPVQIDDQLNVEYEKVMPAAADDHLLC